MTNNSEMPSKILIVDDEKDIVDLVQYHLEKDWFIVKSSTNGRDAIKIARSFLPDLILLDVMMPEIDGMETCVEIREDQLLKNTIVAFLTARS